MATGARAAVAKSGAEVDGQRFRPHLTLARLNRPVEATKFVHLLDAYAGPAWTIEEIALVASRTSERVLATGHGTRSSRRFSLGRAGSGPGPDAAPPRGR